MAYDRAAPDKTFIANMLRADDQDEHTRQLLNALAKILNLSYAQIQADTIAQLVTALGNAGV